MGKQDPFEECILNTWKKIKTKVVDTINSEQREKKESLLAELSSRGLIQSGIAVSRQVDLLVKGRQSMANAALEEFKRLCVENKLRPSRLLKESVEESLLCVFNAEDALSTVASPFTKSSRLLENAQHSISRAMYSAKARFKADCDILWDDLKLKLQDKATIFISSSQNEFLHERALIKHLIESDKTLGRFFSVFVFESTGSPATSPPEDVYLAAVESSDIYVGLFKEQMRDAVIKEYTAAKDKNRLLFVDCNSEKEPKLTSFLESIKNEVTYYQFSSFNDLMNRISTRLLELIEVRKKQNL